VNFRALSVADLDGCLELTKDRGWTTDRTAWLTLLRSGRAFGFDDRGELSGSVVIVTYDRMAFVGMMLVRKRLEGRGLGRSLLEFALSETSDKPAALFATEFGRPLYEKLGFVARDMLCTHRGVWTCAASERRVTLRKPSELTKYEIARIVEVDAAAFGSNRASLFSELLDRSSWIATIVDGERLSYAIARESEGGVQVGPLIAVDDESAFALVASLVSVGNDCRIHVTEGKTQFRDRLAACGLVLTQELPMMTRGNVKVPNASWYAVASKATG